MAIIKCKMCGGDLTLTEGSVIAECEYCGTTQTVPAADNEKKLNLFARANRLRAGCEFDKASGVYETIVADFPEEPEAYWGLVLCKYGIEYVDDPATGKKVPTCHRSSFDSVMDDENFELTLENADATARKIYREEARQIEELRKGIIEVSSKEDPYDIFICYKETGENGERTLDSVLAQDIYDALTAKGNRVFFARITLEDKLGQEFEPYIFSALNSAKLMLVVGTDYEHFNAIWVKNEWSRYLKLMTQDKEKYLIPCYKGIDAYDLPKEFAKLQAQDLGKVGAIQDLLRGVEKLIKPAEVQYVQKEQSIDVSDLIAQGNESLQAKAWKIASRHFDMALNVNPRSAEAYLGKFMASRKLKAKDDIKKQILSLNSSENFREALHYAEGALRQELQTYNKIVKRKATIRTIITAACVVALIVSSGIMMLNKILRTEEDFLSGKITAEKVQLTFSQMDWLVQPSEQTCFWMDVADHVPFEQLQIPEQLVLTQGALNYLTAYGSSEILSATKSVTFSGEITEIPNGAFKSCPLTSFSLPDGVLTIGDDAFRDCYSLAEITVPDSITHIGAEAFFECTKLAAFDMPDSLISIGEYAFYNCHLMSAPTLPEGLTSIGQHAFDKCSTMTSINIPSSVTSIGLYAFKGCNGLTEVTIPASVTTMDGGIFAQCKNLQKIYCEAPEKPEGWDEEWNTTNVEVIWGATP